MVRLLTLLLFCLTTTFGSSLYGQDSDPKLTILFPDVEGAGGTLIVTPTGESILIDPGWPGREGRVSQRIANAARSMGVDTIDYFVSTHFDFDHYAALPELMEIIPIKKFYDRGKLEDSQINEKHLDYVTQYFIVTAGNLTALRPGDTLPLRNAGLQSVKIRCLASNLEILAKNNKGAHRTCQLHKPRKEDTSENARSVALMLSYGDFQFFMGADLTWNIEHNLVCPVNVVEDIDVLQVDHHGLSASSNPLLYHALSPEVAIYANGKTKGPQSEVVRTLRGVRSMNAVYQANRNEGLTPQENTIAENIANDGPDAAGAMIKVEVGKNFYKIYAGSNKGTAYPIQ
jgi:competence protein ComEC